jgi:ABC-type uncharacterized transport system ATPase subunit
VLEVVGVEKHKIVARSAAGAQYELTGKQAKCFEVYEQSVIEIGAQDRILLTANRREAGFRATNGEIVTVSGVDGQGRIQLEDGRTLPANYKHFAHGYAVTAHRSQGKTVDAVVISGDAMKKELFYVAATRGREKVTVVTSDKELLRESVGWSAERQSASELVRKMNEEKARASALRGGLQRGMITAKAMARQAVRQEREQGTVDLALEREKKREMPVREHQRRRGHEDGIGR